MANPAFEQVIELILQTSGDPEVLKLASAIKELNKTAELSDDSMGDLVRQLDQLQKTAATSAGLDRLTQRTQQLQQEQGALAAAVERAGLRLQLQARVQQEASEAMERARAASAQVRAEQERYAESGNKSVLVQRELKAAVRETAEAQKAAERAFAQANTALNGATREYERVANAQEKLDTQLASSRSNLQAAQRASEGLGKSQSDLARALDTTRKQALANAQAVEATAQRLAEGDDRFRRLAAASRTSAEALQRHRAAAAQAAQGQDSVNDSAQRGVGIFDRLRGALAAVGVALGLREAGQAVAGIARIGDEAERTRIRLEGLYGTQEEANRVFDELRRIADENGQSFDNITEAAARLKGFGLDPLDGTLQSLIDQNAKLGGSQQQLEGIILAVGQAWAKQKLQGEEILQLVERGVPVWDLLAQATGKNVQELQRLSERGELGRETIQALLQEIGNASEGAAARGLGTLGAQFQLVRNRAQEFLETVANSGVLDFFKTQLDALNTEVRRLASDGTLTQYAKSVSDGIVATAEAVKSAVVFVRDYSGALIQLAKSLAAIKFAQFIVGLGESAAAMLAAGRAAAGTAQQIGGLRGALASIPASVKIAVAAVGIELAISQWSQLADKIRDAERIESEALQAGVKAAEQRNALNERVRAIVQIYGNFADEVIRATAEVKNLTEREAQDYEVRLDNARRYYNALALLAEKDGRQEAARQARESAEQYARALEIVKRRLDDIRSAAQTAFGTVPGDQLGRALEALGVDAETAGVKITTAGQKIIENFRIIATDATATGEQIKAAFTRAIDGAKTSAEIQAIREAFELAFQAGKVGQEEFAKGSVVAEAALGRIRDAALEAARGFGEIEKAGTQATQALIATLEASRSQLAAKANQLAGEIGRGLRAGLDTSALQAELAQVEGQINSATGQINEASGALDRLSGSSDRAAGSLSGVGVAAQDVGGSMRSVEQAADESFGNIGNKVSQVTGGPLAALGAEFERIRQQAVALGDEATRAFDATLQVGETVRGTGFTIEQFYQRQIDRLALAERTTQELATAYNNSASQAERLANATGEVAQNAALSLEAQRAANLEYARQLLEIDQGRAQAQQAAAAGLERQVNLTKELSAVRETSPPQRIEITANNRQKPGEILQELSERDLAQLAGLVLQQISISGRQVRG
jgi:tape measure domain-containing protein